jgi:flavodoxin I
MTSSAGYTFKKSKALMGDQFVGLALDEDNQKDQSEARLSDWLASISSAWQ